MTLRERLSILPEWEATPEGDVDIPERWWNWRREWEGDWPNSRYRVIVGDLLAEAEHESGETMGLQFAVELNLFENTGHFDDEGWRPKRVKLPARKFEDHSFSLIVGRWGIYIALRGKEIRDGSD